MITYQTAPGAAVSKVRHIKALMIPYACGVIPFLERVRKNAVNNVNSRSPTAIQTLDIVTKL